MEHYAGIDVSLTESSVCVVDGNGKIVREVKVASAPETLCELIAGFGVSLSRIGMEAGPLSQWLREGLVDAGFEVVLLETRYVKAALSAMTVKTDRKDARGIAQLLRMGWYRPVHAKSAGCQDVRALLVGRKLLQTKLLDVELSIRGILRGFGLKMGEVSRGRFEARVRELADGHAMLEVVAEGEGRVMERVHPPTSRDAEDRAAGSCLSAADECARGWRPGRNHLPLGGRRAWTLHQVADRRRVFWADAEELPIRRDRHRWRGEPGW